MSMPAPLPHRLRPLVGRDPGEPHRAATPLELLYDLTFAIAFGATSAQLAHAVVGGSLGAGLLAFAFTTFAVSWAWINYAWWASAFDTDDWLVRLLTLVQMIGVLVIALGVPDVFASIEAGTLDIRVVVLGYVVIRLGQLALWVRVAVQDAAHRRDAIVSAAALLVAQLGWVALGALELPIAVALVAAVPLYLVELCGPILAEFRFGRSPWHPHHIGERYSCLVLVTLGEVVIGTATTVGATVQDHGWSVDAALVAAAGMALAFGLWWVVFLIPSGEVLARAPRRGFAWGYGHIVVFGSLVAVGAGLDVAALAIEGGSLEPAAVATGVALPVGVLLAAIFVLYSLLVGSFSPFHTLLFVIALVLLVASVGAAAAGAPLAAWLALVVLAPATVIVGVEAPRRHR